MKIASLNVRLDLTMDHQNQFIYRVPIIKIFILKEQPDVLAVQELTPSMLNLLSGSYSDYHYYGEPRENNGEMAGIFIKSKFPVIHNETIWLSDTPNQESKFEDSAYLRVATFVTAQMDPFTQLTFVSIHLDYTNEGVRIRQAQVILDYIASHDLENVILLGDFNAEFHDHVHLYLKHHGFQMITTNSFSNTLTFHGFTGNQIGSPIDYMYINFDLKKFEFTVLQEKNPYISDHYPLLLSFEESDIVKKH